LCEKKSEKVFFGNEPIKKGAMKSRALHKLRQRFIAKRTMNQMERRTSLCHGLVPVALFSLKISLAERAYRQGSDGQDKSER